MLDVTPQGVSLVAQRANKADKVLTSAGLDVDSKGVLVFAEDALGGYKSKIDVQAKQIALVVGGTSTNPEIKAAEIVGSINNMGSTVRISANRINLDGYVTASQLSAVSAEFDNLISGRTTATKILAGAISASEVSSSHGYFTNITFKLKDVSWKTATIGGTTITYLGE